MCKKLQRGLNVSAMPALARQQSARREATHEQMPTHKMHLQTRVLHMCVCVHGTRVHVSESKGRDVPAVGKVMDTTQSKQSCHRQTKLEELCMLGQPEEDSLLRGGAGLMTHRDTPPGENADKKLLGSTASSSL